MSDRLDDLDRRVDDLAERAEKASSKTRSKLEQQARELRAEAKHLRNRMSTWDDGAKSSWRSAKLEIEQGLEKTENAIKKTIEDIKQ